MHEYTNRRIWQWNEPQRPIVKCQGGWFLIRTSYCADIVWNVVVLVVTEGIPSYLIFHIQFLLPLVVVVIVVVWSYWKLKYMDPIMGLMRFNSLSKSMEMSSWWYVSYPFLNRSIGGRSPWQSYQTSWAVLSVFVALCLPSKSNFST